MVLETIAIILAVVVIAFIINTVEVKKVKGNSLISFKEAMDLVELPVITFYNGEVKLNFLLDTGSNISYLNSSLIPHLNCSKSEEVMTTMGIDGNKIEGDFYDMTITYKNSTFEESFGSVDLDKAFDNVKQESGVQIHGILGSKFFEKYKYVLDFKELVAYTK